MQSIIPGYVDIFFAVILIGILLNKFNLPNVIGYIIAGMLIGPHGLNLFANEASLNILGEAGVLILLFFVGMEISIGELMSKWKMATMTLIAQLFISFFILSFGYEWLGGSLSMYVLLAFMLTLSSTAVIVKWMQDRQELQSPIGKVVLGILILQDIMVAPMIICLHMMAGEQMSLNNLLLQLLGLILIAMIFYQILREKTIQLPFARAIKADHDLQVFFALGICMASAYLTAKLGLSSGLGAFVAGIIVSGAKETEWVKCRLESFRILFMALFFVHIGMILNLEYIWENIYLLTLLLLLVFSMNTLIMSLLLKLSGLNHYQSIYAGLLLSQIGEFGFVVSQVGFQLKLVPQSAYQLFIALIALSILFSGLWILLMKPFLEKAAHQLIHKT